MAVRFDASTDMLSRTTNLPATTGPWTMMGWYKISVDRNAYSCALSIGNLSGNAYYSWQTDTDGTTTLLWNGTSLDTGPALTVGTWYHLAMTKASGGNVNGYIDGVVGATLAQGTSSAVQTMRFGNDPDSEWWNGCLAALKVWDAELTAAEVVQEMRQYLPARMANINGFYPCLSIADDEIDYSGLGRNLTVGGTLATEDGPPIPWKAGRQRLVHMPAATAFPWHYYAQQMAG